MFRIEKKDKLSNHSRKIIYDILEENIEIASVFLNSENEEALNKGLGEIANHVLNENPAARDFRAGRSKTENFYKLRWKDYAAIRILDYIRNAGQSYTDPNNKDELVVNQPLRLLWTAIRTESSSGSEELFLDMYYLFRQLAGKVRRKMPCYDKTLEWMERYNTGLEPEIIKRRAKNRDRILTVIIKKLEEGSIKSSRFIVNPSHSFDENLETARKWWKDYRFHLRMAVRSTADLKEMMGDSLGDEEFETIAKAEKAGIPIFINPHYLSLMNMDFTEKHKISDHTIRDYVFVNKDLLSEFGSIRAWEKEDSVIAGKPNAAGWMLPDVKGLHRRYPEVAIFIPQTTGRSCGGLCVSCQRMYDFQSGQLNFNIDKLKPRRSWTHHLALAMDYFRNDSQLRDILVTGGDAFMSSNHSLEIILQEILNLARNKINDNKKRPEGEKYAEMLRVRLGTRLPVYLPQRFNNELIQILSNFKNKAIKTGIKQFIIQTHFVSPLEVTSESEIAVRKLLEAGWLVTNQAVFTAAAARRGHSAKLRQALNDIGILSYYTFQVKGFKENKHNFTPVSRAIQEMVEEKKPGILNEKLAKHVLSFSKKPEKLVKNLRHLRNDNKMPFIATDRSVLNLPGVGKSLSFRVIGLTNDGRRILEFEHDKKRCHSPIIKTMGNVTIIESKSISEFLNQLAEIGEDRSEYQTLFGYTVGITEDRFPLYEYPSYDYEPTKKMTNLGI